MTVKALTGLVAEWFTPTSQEGEDKPARFKIMPLNGEQFNFVLPDVQFTTTSAVITGAAVRDILGYGLVDWEGVEGADGSALDCTKANHKYMPGFLRVEIASKIFTDSIVDEGARKN